MDYIKKLKEILEVNNVSQEMIARDLGVTLVTFNRWLNKKAIPRKKAENKIKTLILKYTTDQVVSVSEFKMDSLVEHIYSEIELKQIALRIKKETSNILEYLVDLIDAIPEKNRNYDWNIGSILQYFDPEILIDAIKKVDNLPRLHNSIGLSWVLGEINRKDVFVINYLRDVVKYSTDGDAMWRAAFSLENLDEEEAIVILKRTTKIDKNKRH
jgi:transcriptional regulator with XRE-family HTH domain